MPTLLLLRHAKSAWGDPELADHDRPLNARGRRAAPAMGRRLRADGYAPDLALCSSARRALETWELVAPELAAKPKVSVERQLYLCGARALLARLRKLSHEVCVLLIAHNPDLHELANGLSDGGGPAADLQALNAKLPTGGLVGLAVASWPALEPGTARLVLFSTPRREGVLS